MLMVITDNETGAYRTLKPWQMVGPHAESNQTRRSEARGSEAVLFFRLTVGTASEIDKEVEDDSRGRNQLNETNLRMPP